MRLSEMNAALGGRLCARRGRLPLVWTLLSVLALLFSTPFRITPDSLWLDVPCLLALSAGIVLRALTAGYACPGGGLRTREMYSLCRHPAELGGGLIWLGVFSYTGLAGWTLCALLLYGWSLEKILLAEEAALGERFGAAYGDYAAGSNALLPRWRAWLPSENRFSLSRALARALRDWSGCLPVLLLLSLLKNRMISFGWSVDLFWLLGGVGLLALLFLVRLFVRSK